MAGIFSGGVVDVHRQDFRGTVVVQIGHRNPSPLILGPEPAGDEVDIEGRVQTDRREVLTDQIAVIRRNAVLPPDQVLAAAPPCLSRRILKLFRRQEVIPERLVIDLFRLPPADARDIIVAVGDQVRRIVGNSGVCVDPAPVIRVGTRWIDAEIGRGDRMGHIAKGDRPILSIHSVRILVILR